MGGTFCWRPPGECKYNTVVQLQHEPQLTRTPYWELHYAPDSIVGLAIGLPALRATRYPKLKRWQPYLYNQ